MAPKLILRPPPTEPVSTDPTIAAIQDTQSVLQQIQRATRLISAPWLIEPPDSESFRNTAGVALPAISATVFTVVAQVTCPPWPQRRDQVDRQRDRGRRLGGFFR